MKLSVIIPVYNVAPYLDNCLSSVLNQDLDDFEVICIDDASTDYSLEVLRRYERAHSKLKVYVNEINRTASYCRKFGVSVANGDYIMFVDSDDELVPGACKKFVKYMEIDNLDILHFETEIVAENSTTMEAVRWFERFSRPHYGELRGNMVFEGCFSKKLYRFNIWNKIYKSDLCKKAFDYIDEGRYPKAQDLYAFFIISFLAKSYRGIKERGYVYHYGRGITGRKSEDATTFRRICSQAVVAKRCKRFLIDMGVYGKYRDEFIAMERDLLMECLSHLDRADDSRRPELSNILIESWLNSDVFYRAYLGAGRPDLSPFEVKKDDVNEEEAISVVFAVNENYVHYLSVTLESILVNKKCKNPIRVYVLHEYVSDNTLNYFAKIERPDFQVIPVSVSKFVKEYNLKPRNHIGVEMYYRLFISDVLPDIEKAIYLDADLVVNADLLDLYSINLGGNILGAVYNGTINYSAKKIIARLETDPREYINSGVLLIDVKNFRKNNIKDQSLDFLTINPNLSNPDQDALNKVCEGRIKLLPLKWNYIWLYNLLYSIEKDEEFKKYCEYYLENCSNPFIVHYAGKDKPWNSDRGYINPKLYDLFWNYASKSPYYRELNRKASVQEHPKNLFKGYYVKGKQGYDYYKSINARRYASELSRWYRQKTGKRLDLTNPQSFNEKIQWIKLFDNSPLKTTLADKYLSRDWIANQIGEGYTVPLIGVWDSADEINFDNLPNKFVLKTNHGSGWNYIVNDKNKILPENVKLKLNLWLEKDYSFSSGFEMQYQKIERKIIAEEFIGDGLGLIDYRFYCFNGVPRQIWVDKYSGTKDHIREIFDTDWNKLDFTCTWPKAKGELDTRPENYDEMLRISSILSKPFNFVRVDFFEVDSKLYVGELTFTPMSGLGKFNPPEYDLRLGKMLNLPTISFSKKISIKFWNGANILLKALENTKGRRKMVENEKSIGQMRKEVESWLNSAKDSSKGVISIKLLADSGDSWAQRILATMYLKGDYVEKNEDKALNLMRKAASSGNITAKKQLVDILIKTGDRKYDRELFMTRLELAEEGEKTAMIRLAGMYLHGRGVERDPNESLRWARTAVDGGAGTDGEKQLVDSLMAVGTQECVTEAFTLRKKLAENGEVISQRNLADMYLLGEGTAEDKDAAIRWYKEAARAGDKYSKEKIKDLK